VNRCSRRTYDIGQNRLYEFCYLLPFDLWTFYLAKILFLQGCGSLFWKFPSSTSFFNELQYSILLLSLIISVEYIKKEKEKRDYTKFKRWFNSPAETQLLVNHKKTTWESIVKHQILSTGGEIAPYIKFGPILISFAWGF
jgi:hypothetical protein